MAEALSEAPVVMDDDSGAAGGIVFSVMSEFVRSVGASAESDSARR